MPTLESAIIACILFGATILASIFGFGAALFAMPLLTLQLDVSIATPLFALVGLTNSLIITTRNWQQVELASAWRLVLATLLGIPFGTALIKDASNHLVIQGLGGFLIGFGLYRLMNWQLPRLTTLAWAIPFGFVAGILGGAYNTNGPPIVVYGSMNRWSPAQFQATLHSYFLPTGVGIVASHGLAGLWSPDIFWLYGMSLPGIISAIVIGSWINQCLSIERFQSWLSGLFILLGILLWL